LDADWTPPAYAVVDIAAHRGAVVVKRPVPYVVPALLAAWTLLAAAAPPFRLVDR